MPDLSRQQRGLGTFEPGIMSQISNGIDMRMKKLDAIKKLREKYEKKKKLNKLD